MRNGPVWLVATPSNDAWMMVRKTCGCPGCMLARRNGRYAEPSRWASCYDRRVCDSALFEGQLANLNHIRESREVEAGGSAVQELVGKAREILRDMPQKVVDGVI